MKIEIVPMTFKDLLIVHKIEKAVFTLPWTVSMFAAELRKTKSSIYLVAKLNHQVIGYTGLFSVFDKGHITTLAVKPELQDQGVGTMLILRLIELSLDKGIRHLTLEVRKSNLKARRLYEKFGFLVVGLRKGYYRDNNEDAIVFCTGNIASSQHQRRLAEMKSQLALKWQVD